MVAAHGNSLLISFIFLVTRKRGNKYVNKQYQQIIRTGDSTGDFKRKEKIENSFL